MTRRANVKKITALAGMAAAAAAVVVSISAGTAGANNNIPDKFWTPPHLTSHTFSVSVTPGNPNNGKPWTHVTGIQLPGFWPQ